MPEIVINFQDTINKANQLEELAGDIRHLCENNITDINGYCAHVWKGDAGEAYRKKMNQISGKLKKRANDLETVAESIGQSVKRLKAADEAIHLFFS